MNYIYNDIVTDLLSGSILEMFLGRVSYFSWNLGNMIYEDQQLALPLGAAFMKYYDDHARIVRF